MRDGTCSIEGCERGPIKARGWCSTHYSRWQRNGDAAADVPVNTDLATPSECGTRSKYTLGCRCTECRDAGRKYAAEYRRKWSTKTLEPDDHRHGRSSGYIMGCRCDRCSEWRRNDPATIRARRKRKNKIRGVTNSDPYTTDEIGDRDDWRCQLCRRKVNRELSHPDPMAPSIDHIIPISHGGADTRANVQLAHLRCNIVKGNRGTDQLRLVG